MFDIRGCDRQDEPRRRRKPAAAMYLRCYPYDSSGMECHRTALDLLAMRLGLPRPLVHLDNGLRGADRLPAREALLAAVADGRIDTVLVPGLFVFALDGRESRAVADRLEQQGCRLIELPSWRARDGWQPWPDGLPAAR
ncbi:hypothetical protein ACFC58_38130 [Kitasatospora purpeofusca]|uniref:hypothetical protein n=1 Tax=Kitasatospora purpeofusca TaxID=67352 RepID=UPI0035DAFE4F